MINKIEKNTWLDSQGKREKIHIQKIKTERKSYHRHHRNPRTIIGYFEKKNATKFNNLEKWMSSQKNNLPRLNYEKLENINRPINSEGIKTTIKNFAKNKI